MPATYPSTFPCVQIEGFNATVAMGAIRSDMNMHQAQRRVFNTMPHTFNLSFVMSVSQWGDWQPWVKANAYKWFTMNLPSLYAGQAGTRQSPHLIRFTSPLTAVNLTEQHVQITVAAELAPSMILKYLDAVS